MLDVFKFIMSILTSVDSDNEDRVNELSKALKSHVEYFTPNYVRKVHAETEIRSSPKILIELWSNYHAVFEGFKNLTNNASEN